jgi:alkanesulfonate monooxygenase SsuD/methylene tetrahydromethanopterin reductase-like flavin-dependent oxidoreductase (luciferase family)
MTRLGFGVASVVGPDVAAAVAPEAERLGYASLWVTDGRATPGLPLMATAQRAAPRIPTGIGVIPIDTRDPAEITATISRLGIDLRRAVIGIGSGRAEHPVRAVRAAAVELRAALPPGARMAIAAVGPRMCRLGGELADVVLLNWMVPERIRWARDRVAEGARRGHRATPPAVAMYVRVAIGPDSRERLADEAGRYARLPSYVRGFAAMSVDPGSIGVAVSDAREVPPLLAPYAEVLDETIVRALPPANDAESVIAIARAAAPR